MELFPTILAANEKHPVLNSEKLTIPIQMELSQKQKTFSEFLSVFFKSGLNLKRFENKDGPQGFCISEITYSANVVR